jgi:hypothetical protein
MTLDQLAASGGVSIWQLAPKGTVTGATLWSMTNIMPLNMEPEIEGLIRVGYALVLCFSVMEMIRLWIRNEIGQSARVLIVKIAVISVILTWPIYSAFCNYVPNVFDTLLTLANPDSQAMNNLFAYMDVAKRGMYGTFVSTSSETPLLNSASPTNVLQSTTYFLFMVVWWAIPTFTNTLAQVMFILGPILLPFGIFKPLSGILGMWIKIFIGLLFGNLLLGIVFILLISSQTITANSVVQGAQETFTSLAFTLVGILIALGMPSFAIRLLGANMNLMSWSR